MQTIIMRALLATTALIATASHSAAQDAERLIGGIIGVIGKAIEEDIAKKQQEQALANLYVAQSQPVRFAIQRELARRGLYRSSIDGLWGAGTSNAIKLYAAQTNQQTLLRSSNGILTILGQLNVQTVEARDQNPGATAPNNQTSNSNSEFYDHNGSTMRVQGRADYFEIVYDRPRSGLASIGIQKGTRLFSGRLENNSIIGTAYVFKKGCEPAPYSVTGGVQSSGTIRLNGAAPVRAQTGCNIIGYDRGSSNAVLVFTQLREDPQVASKPPQKEDPLGDIYRARPAEVRLAIQRELANFGFYKSTIDGLWGEGTSAAVSRYAYYTGQQSLLKSSDGMSDLLDQLNGPEAVAAAKAEREQKAAERRARAEEKSQPFDQTSGKGPIESVDSLGKAPSNEDQKAAMDGSYATCVNDFPYDRNAIINYNGSLNTLLKIYGSTLNDQFDFYDNLHKSRKYEIAVLRYLEYCDRNSQMDFRIGSELNIDNERLIYFSASTIDKSRIIDTININNSFLPNFFLLYHNYGLWKAPDSAYAAIRSRGPTKLTVSNSTIGSFGFDQVYLKDAFIENSHILQFNVSGELWDNAIVNNSIIEDFSIISNSSNDSSYKDAVNIEFNNSVIYGRNLSNYLEPSYNLKFCNTDLLNEIGWHKYERMHIDRDCKQTVKAQNRFEGALEEYPKNNRIATPADIRKEKDEFFKKNWAYETRIECLFYGRPVNPTFCFTNSTMTTRNPHWDGDGSYDTPYSLNRSKGFHFDALFEHEYDAKIEGGVLSFKSLPKTEYDFENDNFPKDGWEEYMLIVNIYDRNGNKIYFDAIKPKNKVHVK